MPIQARGADGLTIYYFWSEGSGTELDPFKSKQLAVQSGDWDVSVNNLPDVFPVSFNWQGLTNSELRAAPVVVSIDSGVMSLPFDASTETKQQQIINKLDGVISQLASTLDVDLDVSALATESTLSALSGKVPQLVLQGDRLKVDAGLPDIYPVDTGLTQSLTLAELNGITVKTQEQNPINISGLATVAKQNEVIAKIPSGLTVTAGKLNVDASVTLPAVYPVSGTVDVSNFPDTFAKDTTLTTFSNKLTLVGDRVKVDSGLVQPLTDTQLRAAAVNTNITNASLAVTGNFYPATQTVAGTVNVDNFPDTQPVSLASLPALAAGSNVIGSISNSSFAISGALPAFASTPTFNVGTISTIATESTLTTLSGKIPGNLTVTATRLLVDGSGVTQPVSGTISANQSGTWNIGSITTLPSLTLSSESGFLTYRNTALSSTAQTIKNGAGSLMGWNAININTTTVYLKFYNTTTPTLGTTTPLLTIMIPPGDGVSPGFFFQEPSLVPIEVFSTAMSVACVTGLADNSTTAPTTAIHFSARYK